VNVNVNAWLFREAKPPMERSMGRSIGGFAVAASGVQTPLMPITVGDHTYIVGKASKSAACIQHPVLKTWQIFKRHTRANRMP
jgi:hypothetical protein